MKQRWAETFRAWAETEEHQRALAEARRIIAQALKESRKPIVNFSGGKDSTVLVHLVLEQKPDVHVLHWDYGRAFVPYPVHREILRIAEQLGVQHLRVETSPLYRKLGRRARNVMGAHLLGKLVPQLAEEGYDVQFIGLRAEESSKRSRRIRSGRSVGAIREVWPLARWRWLDVWAYIVTRGLPYLSLYDARAELVGYDRARFTTLFDPEFADIGGDTIDNVLHWRYRHIE
jgi:3'-phosphoadenosine 5'-phosphosulfate sulfotransferase (PAPS reductase)/FAD synthetase